MKLGIFLPNGRNGYILSKATSLFNPTFQHNKDISVEGEQNGFDMVLSMMKYRGFGGETGYWDGCLETFTLMAGNRRRHKPDRALPVCYIISASPGRSGAHGGHDRRNQ